MFGHFGFAPHQQTPAVEQYQGLAGRRESGSYLPRFPFFHGHAAAGNGDHLPYFARSAAINSENAGSWGFISLSSSEGSESSIFTNQPAPYGS